MEDDKTKKWFSDSIKGFFIILIYIVRLSSRDENMLEVEDFMKGLVLWLASLVNEVHDQITLRFGIQMTDKELHFWVIGLVGILFFLLTYLMFKWIDRFKFKTTILAFIYTFTMMIVLVFAIEIQQAITNRGNMEFTDAVMGLWGFVVFFFIYSIVAGIMYGLVQLLKKRKNTKNRTGVSGYEKKIRSKKMKSLN